MLKRLFYWECAGMLFTTIAGSILHFVYDWSEKSNWIAFFVPVNESTWEHLKLLFFPLLIFSIIEYFVIGRHYPSFLPAKAISILCGMFLIVALFYTYSGILGSHILIIDILIFMMATASSAFLCWAFTAQHEKIKPICVIVSIALLIMVTCCFVLFTYYTPEIGLFLDPVTQNYGI